MATTKRILTPQTEMMKKRKSILFGPMPPPYGGVSIFMTALSAKAIEQGVRVWSYTGKPLSEFSTKILFLKHRRFGHIMALLREGYGARISDSSHFHLEYPNMVLLPLWLIAKVFLRFKWIKILHDGSLPSRFKNFNVIQRLLFRFAVRRIDAFTVCNRELESWLRDNISYSKIIVYIPTLLPLPSDWGNEDLNEDIKDKLKKFSQHKKRICSIGAFIPSYGFLQVADAIEKLRNETREDIGLLLVDGGFALDENFRASVLNGRDWIEVLEKVPHPNLSQVFSESHVFVRGFAHESYGLSRIEAIWCGVPVIATSEGETRGMLTYDFDDETTLINHLKKVLNDDDVSDTKVWTEIFKREAEENLNDYLRVIRGEELSEE